MMVYAVLAHLCISPLLIAAQPPHTDYCAMLSREIQGIQHGFLAGNNLYYCGGTTDAYWNVTENETIGLTHPMFRDGRARGHGIVTDKYGTGHDKWGWEFWRKVRIAYGTVIVNNQRHENPVPDKMIWRPDRQICEYTIDGVRIREVKFISRSDVLCDIITSSAPVTIEFSGQSFFNKDNIGTFDGDPLIPFSQNSTAQARYVQEVNTLHIIEGGDIVVKPSWGEKAVTGKLMYDRMSVLLSASQNMGTSLRLTQQEQGYWSYKFTLACRPDAPLTLGFAMSDSYQDAAERLESVMNDPIGQLENKTIWFNDLLNRQIPYFRCSDEQVVKTYYYLWSLYFMYFTQSDGWEQFPHTQTAINNFMGLHCWDSWVYSLMGAWVADKTNWAYGNILSWQFMVPYKSRNNRVPDNFGKAWYSPVWMGLEMVAENAWRQYEQSGDRVFLQSAYDDLFRPLYYDGGPKYGYGIDLLALDALTAMAEELGRKDDAGYWQTFRPARVKAFRAGWENRRPDYFGGGTFRDIWNLASLLSPAMERKWAERFTSKWIMNTETGFMGPVPLEIRPPDEIENGVFAVSTISTWLATEGMFRHHLDAEAIHCSLGHLNGMVKDFGFPVAPECWDPDYRPWGSMYYNWDGAMIPLILGRLAGITYSIPQDTFVVEDHLPESWNYVHTITPVKHGGNLKWCDVRIERQESRGTVEKTVQVRNCSLNKLEIKPWLEDRKVAESHQVEAIHSQLQTGHGSYLFTNSPDALVKLVLKEKHKSVPLLVRATPFERKFFDQITVTLESLMSGSEVFFTTDGSEPTKQANRYRKPLILDRTTTLTTRAFRNGDLPGPIMVTQWDKTPLLEPVRLTSSKAGLHYEYYEGQWQKLPDFDRLKPRHSGQVSTFVFPGDLREQHFALRYRGYVQIPADEIYYFNVRSNDGSQLFVDDELVVDLNIGKMGRDPWDRTGSIALKAGMHSITLLYHQAARTKHLQVKWGRENNSLSLVPPDALYHN
jgi:hypothetical protein